MSAHAPVAAKRSGPPAESNGMSEESDRKEKHAANSVTDMNLGALQKLQGQFLKLAEVHTFTHMSVHLDTCLRARLHTCLHTGYGRRAATRAVC